jgi:hypothetical protein
MDVSKAVCPECRKPLQVARMACPDGHMAMEAQFGIPALARLSLEDQIFVVAFVRHHGSIKKMERLFEVSYPTVKNRLNAISRTLDKNFDAPPPNPNLQVLEDLEKGSISVDEAIERLR